MAMPNHIFRFYFFLFFLSPQKSIALKQVSECEEHANSDRLDCHKVTGKINLFILCGRKRKSNDTTRLYCEWNQVFRLCRGRRRRRRRSHHRSQCNAIRFVTLCVLWITKTLTRTQLNECNVFDVNDYDMIWKCDSIFSHVGSSHACNRHVYNSIAFWIQHDGCVLSSSHIPFLWIMLLLLVW